MRNKKKVISTSLMLLPLGFMLSGCPSFATMIPDLAPSLVPSVNLTNINVNSNQISCYQGGVFSSDYCSIPISRFISIIGGYADPYDVNLLITYDLNNHQHFFFDDINHTSTIDKLNKSFLASYPAPDKFAQMPTAVQDLYIRIREKYIPNHDYKNLYSSYIYLYTISALHFATSPCTVPYSAKGHFVPQNITLQKEMLYKSFAIRYANDVLHHVYGQVNGKYDSETDLYNAIYRHLLEIDYNKLQNLAQDIFATINNNMPQFESAFFTESGVSFGDIGYFGCSAKKGGYWTRYDYEYFGNNVSGIDLRVQFKEHDLIDKASSSKTMLIVDGPESGPKINQNY